MKTKTYEIEVVTVKKVQVVLPETYLSPDLHEDWESDLWTLDGETAEDKARDIAIYAAHMSAGSDMCVSHDGVGKMIEDHRTQADYKANRYQVKAVVTGASVTETDVVSETAWAAHE